MIAAPNLDAVGRLLERVTSYYNAAPVVWWTIVGLIVLWLIAWGGAFRRSRKD